ncbi:MAG: hypothetical protein ACLTER_12910 [Ruminococcus sp.]
MTCALCLENFREEAFFGRESKSMLEEIHGELPVEVMELVFILAKVFFAGQPCPPF